MLWPPHKFANARQALAHSQPARQRNVTTTTHQIVIENCQFAF